MTKTKWTTIITLCLIFNGAVSLLVFKTPWAFVVLALFELAFYIRHRHRQRIYEDGLVAISPKNLFKRHEENLHQEIVSEITNRTEKNATDLDQALDEFDREFRKSQMRFSRITDDVEVLLSVSNHEMQDNMEQNADRLAAELEQECEDFRQMILRIQPLSAQIQESGVIDPGEEIRKIETVIARLKTELNGPQRRIDRRVLLDFENLHLKIGRFQRELEKSLKLRYPTQGQKS